MKSYYTEDWTVHMLQVHRLPLLPHSEERVKSPICQDFDEWDTEEKRKARSPTPHDLCCTLARNKYQALVFLAASQVFLRKSN